VKELSEFFPMYILFIFLTPYFYLVTKIAAEKESKAREGMKMMGLSDSTYYVSWLILYSVISVLISAVITVMTALGVFINVNLLLLFGFFFIYSMTFFGWAFLIVAFLPTPRSSGIAAVLIAIISYNMMAILRDPTTPANVQYGMSILPNVCMALILRQIFFYNYFTAEGMTFSTGSVMYENYSVRAGMVMLVINVFLWLFIGLYFDQVIPSQYGVAKPWYFLCRCKKRRAIGEADPAQTPLVDGDVPAHKDRRNFEAVPDSLKKQEQNEQCLKVRGLTKKFGQKTAVNGVNLTMYSG